VRITCQGTRRNGDACRQTLIEVTAANAIVSHEGLEVVLRGEFVSGSLRCPKCRTLRHLGPTDLGQPARLAVDDPRPVIPGVDSLEAIRRASDAA
jgi:hypothetical protein